MSDIVKDWSTALAAVLETQCALIQELEPLAAEQGVLIESGNMTALMELLGRRQEIIDRFAATERELHELSVDLPQRLGAISSERRSGLAELMGRVDEGLRGVEEIDRRDGASLGTRREEIAVELSNLGTAAKARRAYLDRAGPRYADHTG